MGSKYHNLRTEYHGRVYDSKKEADHAVTLDLMRLATDPSQRVESIQYQYRIPLVVNGIQIGHYVADFYVLFADGHKEIQDVKGMKTALYNWKKKHVEAQYGEKIIEI
jgi:hypothetical protein